ncbi:DoxX family protein [Orrella sp. JC864]|uniref:DoxX family protein n=1 Tax=Orrella sp. JC864 TaxID=3120298 RepID=UPI0012BCFF97
MSTYDDAGKLVLRLSIGILMLFHGLFKLANGIGGIQGMVAGAGLPGFFAYGVYVGEVIAPILLILGLFTRPAAILVAINMLVAILLAHASQLGQFTKMGGWALELQGLFLFGAIAIALMGGGRYGLSRR